MPTPEDERRLLANREIAAARLAKARALALAQAAYYAELNAAQNYLNLRNRITELTDDDPNKSE